MVKAVTSQRQHLWRVYDQHVIGLSLILPYLADLAAEVNQTQPDALHLIVSVVTRSKFK